MFETLISHFGALDTGLKCSASSSLFNFPHWYQYLNSVYDQNGICTPEFTSLSDIWLIVAAIIDILLRVAALVAVAMIIYGGISYMTSQANPKKIGKAKSTLINAFVGLVISVTAASIVAFIAGSIN